MNAIRARIPAGQTCLFQARGFAFPRCWDRKESAAWVPCALRSLWWMRDAAAGFDYSKEPDREVGFVVGPSDVLRINVWKTPTSRLRSRCAGWHHHSAADGDVTAAVARQAAARRIKRKLTHSARRQPSRGHRGNCQQLPLHRGWQRREIRHVHHQALRHGYRGRRPGRRPNRYADWTRCSSCARAPLARVQSVNIKEIYSGRTPRWTW